MLNSSSYTSETSIVSQVIVVLYRWYDGMFNGVIAYKARDDLSANHVASLRMLNFKILFVSTAKYNVDQTQISVSGFDSGADMATQLHVSYSSVIMGVGIIAGSKYIYT